MSTTKEEAVAVISKLSETVDIDEILEELARHFRQEQSSSFQDATNQIETSCLDLAKHYIGCIEGPADLSTNKAYFKNFGS
jgi:hypothetical protein